MHKALDSIPTNTTGKSAPMKDFFIMISLLSLHRKLDIDSVQSKEIAKKTLLMLCFMLPHLDSLLS